MQEKLQIETAQYVKIDYTIASFGERLSAFLIDLVVFWLFYVILSFALLSVLSSSAEQFLGAILRFFPLYGWILYHFFTGIYYGGNTIGKNAVKIKIVRVDGEVLNPLDYFIRSIFFIIDLFFSAGALGGISILGTTNNQRLGGLATNSVVVRLSTSNKFNLGQILKMDTLDGYKTTYQGVKHLTEIDALTIKKVLNRSRKYKNDSHRKALRLTALKTADIIEFENPVKDNEKFLKSVLKDYIILTR